MRVFKGYMLLWLRNWKMSLMYFGIFLGIVFLIQFVTGETADIFTLVHTDGGDKLL